MADERFSNDPYRPTLPGDDLRNPGRLELQHNELQPDPGLAGGPARIAIYAVATLALGAAFYGLDKLSSIHWAETSPSAQNVAPKSTAQNSQPAPTTAPPGMREAPPGRHRKLM